MQSDLKIYSPGSPVEEILYGYQGFVREVFPNFWSITPNYIPDKPAWLSLQIVPIDLEERTHRWVVIDTLDGDQVLAPKGRVQLCKAKIFIVKGIFLRNRNANRDYLQERIAPFKDYTLMWLEEKKQWFILPRIHFN